MRTETIIATHANTDFDAFASMLAVRRLYPGSVVCVSGSLNRNVRELCRLYAEELELVEASRLELDAVRRLIVVEAANASRLGELEPVALDPAVEKVVFDHHVGESPDWASPDNVILSQDGALTTTLVGILAEREIAVSALEATVFALGIHEDTGSLTYPSATQRDADALSWCLRHGARQDMLGRYLHTPLSEQERALLDALVESLEPHELPGITALVAAISWPSYVEGVSNLAHKIVDLTDARALVLLVEMDRRVFCVVRSRTPSFDAAAAAAALGGGGHEQAASAIYRGPLADAQREILAALPAAVSEPLRARDVMSRPARVVAPSDTVADAMALCQRYNQSGVLVADDGKLVGSVAREDLDRAIGHGLSHAPVKGIMSGRTLETGVDAPLSELQQLLAGSAEGRIAIVDGEAVAGVVTRRDVLRALDEAAEPADETGESIAAELRALPRLERAFGAIAAASEGVEGVYLVGGTVRDILLGEESFDVDIAVEGDAIALARRIARELDGRTREHVKFGTAVVLYGDEERVDVVTARTEFYDAPAALPAVEHASIREDLFRRDFTINAMAASLKGEDFGRLVDPFGGREDLAAGTLRVLHNLSFIEDPTRIFRAIRYENRYGFRMDEHTARLARSCVEMGLVGDLSSARLRDELTALLEEGEVSHSLPRLAEIGAAGAIHPHLAADDEAVALFDRGRKLARELGVDVPDWRLGLTVLARRMPAAEVTDWLDRLRLRKRDADLVVAAVAVAPRIVSRLREETLLPSDIVTIGDQYAPDAPLFALALEELEPIRRYFEELRHVRLDVAGAELAELGLGESPRVGEILAELRRRKLDGELDGRDAELAAARELIQQA